MADTRFSITKLNNENYQVWKFKVELLLIKEDLWDQVNSDVPQNEEMRAQWVKNDNKARAIIGLLVEDSQLLHIRKATTAKEVWNALKNYHEKSTLTSKVYLLRQICNLKLSEDGCMETHVNTMLGLVEKLTALGEELVDHLIVAMLLSSLPESYGTLITALESRSETELTLDLVKGKLLDEYKRRKGVAGVVQNGDSALKVTQNRGINDDKECFFCKKSGHFKKDCRKYAKWKSGREKSNQVSENDGNSSSICFCVRDDKKNQAAWFVDSGSTSHMTSNRNFFIDFTPKNQGEVAVANGKMLKVLGIGSGEIKCLNENNKEITVTLKDVLYVPKLEENLISVKRLTEKGFRVNFDKDKCQIIKGNVMIAHAVLSSNLYAVVGPQKAMAVIDNQHTQNCQHTWHRRFGHRHMDVIHRLKKENLVTGIDIKDCGIRQVCECCIEGKLTRKTFPKESLSNTHSVLDLIHTDVCGPMQTATPGRKKYFLTLIDDYSRYTVVYFLENKSEVPAYIKEYVQYVKTKFNRKPKIIRSDNGGEFVNNSLKKFYAQEGIQAQHTTAYSPQQNGIAERKNRTLMEAARCMLFDANMKKKYWAEAINTANDLQNILPTRAVKKTPFEYWNRRKPKVDHLQIFGSRAYVHIPKEKRRKLEVKAIPLTFVGYSMESKAYRFVDQATDKITISRDVKFVDLVETETKKIKEQKQTPRGRSPEIEMLFEDSMIHHENNYTPDEQNGADAEQNDEQKQNQQSIYETDFDESSEQAGDDTYEYNGPDDLEIAEVRRLERTNRGVPPDRFGESANSAVERNTEPRTWKEAMSGAHRAEWKAAMNEEMESLYENHTWELTALPADRKTIGSKWVYKRKINPENGTARFKARLVAQGFAQKYGTDYDEVFAPVVKSVTFRLLLAIAGKRNLSIHHYDAKTAFLNGELKEIIYIKQPEGYEQPDKKQMVCKLRKSIYGLKQAAKVWNEKLHSILSQYSFGQSKIDPCLYIKQHNEETIYLIIYVDDILIACANQNLIRCTAQQLQSQFFITDLGKIANYLGIKIERDIGGVYQINQTNYIEKIARKFGLQDAKTSKVPLDPGYYKIMSDADELEQQERYQSLIGGLLYIAVNSRPDIAASISILSQQLKQPTELDWNEAKRTVRYLMSTKHLKLKLGGSSTTGLIAYADADWAEDKRDRKSNSGFLLQFAGGTISWACRKQTCIALSTAEAEYISLGEASKEIIWMRDLLEDFDEKQTGPTTIFEDNQSCIKMVTNKKYSNRTKHIDTKFHFVKDLVEKNIIQLQYCASENMIADLLTKPLAATKLKALREACHLIE